MAIPYWTIAIKLKSFAGNACRMRDVDFEENLSDVSRDTAKNLLVLQVKCLSLQADSHQHDTVSRQCV